MPDKHPSHCFPHQIFGQVGCGLLVWGAIILGCMGMYSCDQREKSRNLKRVFDANQPFLTANDSKVKILWVYPQHGHKGRFVGHYAVVEGMNDKTRREINTHPALPVPEEIWLIKLDANGYIQFDKKIGP